MMTLFAELVARLAPPRRPPTPFGLPAPAVEPPVLVNNLSDLARAFGLTATPAPLDPDRLSPDTWHHVPTDEPSPL